MGYLVARIRLQARVNALLHGQHVLEQHPPVGLTDGGLPGGTEEKK